MTTIHNTVTFQVSVNMTQANHDAFMSVLSAKGLATSFEGAVEGIINVLAEDENHNIMGNLIDWSMEAYEDGECI